MRPITGRQADLGPRPFDLRRSPSLHHRHQNITDLMVHDTVAVEQLQDAGQGGGVRDPVYPGNRGVMGRGVQRRFLRKVRTSSCVPQK